MNVLAMKDVCCHRKIFVLRSITSGSLQGKHMSFLARICAQYGTCKLYSKDVNNLKTNSSKNSIHIDVDSMQF